MKMSVATVKLPVTIFTALWLLVNSVQAFSGTKQDPRDGIDFGIIDERLIDVCYSGGETFRYDVSYTGGLKLGELHLSVEATDEVEDGYIIHARITTDNGMFSRIYPIEDVHVTRVKGSDRLPYHYEVWQKEGYSYEAHRVSRYLQDQGKILYQHNDKPVETFVVKTPIQNEFSSFFASRLMAFTPGTPFLVPTFADEKRNEVVVMVRGTELVEETILGDVDTMVVEPIMEFSGLYDKRGDTVIWYTNDECRVPVQVNSRLVLGSLTAKLVSYRNSACARHDGAMLEKYRKEIEAAADDR
jgi:hypothetical protein